MSIYIFISDVASYIGKNKFDPTKAFERLWKKVDKENIKNVLLLIEDEIHSLDMEITKLKDSITKMTRTKKKELDDLIHKRDALGMAIDNFSLSQRALITKECSKLNEIIDDTTLSPQKKKKLIILEVKNMEKTDTDRVLDKEAKKALEDTLISVTNTSHGTKKEESSLDKYKKEYDIEHLDTSQEFFKTCFYENFFICGKMDGIEYLNNERYRIVEVKNRTKGFFNEIRDYEMIQMQLYMYISGINQCRLVEDYKGHLKIYDVEKDQELIEETLELLKQFISNFRLFLKENDSIKKEYIVSSNLSKKRFLEESILPYPKKPSPFCLL